MGNNPLDVPTLVGIVAVDETLAGGRTKGRGRAYKGNKMWVAGALQRGGNVRLERIPNVKRKTLHGVHFPSLCKDKAEAIYIRRTQVLPVGITDQDSDLISNCRKSRFVPLFRFTSTRFNPILAPANHARVPSRVARQIQHPIVSLVGRQRPEK